MKASDARVRQSQLISTFGVGSIMPAGDKSYVVCGLDEWDEQLCASVEEPRLARSLGVHAFKAPASGSRRGDIPVARFPTFHYCPDCRRLDSFWKFDATRMVCPDCVRELTPSRFVACCENGHMEDFPYFSWVHRPVDGVAPWTEGSTHKMSLKTRGTSSSLGDIIVSCSCGVRPRDLEGAFSRHAVAEVKSCSGARPWLPGAEAETCDEPLRALQRGSSNVWFGAVRSSISIPPWSSPSARYVTRYWDIFQHQTDDQIRDAAVGSAARDRTIDVEAVLQVTRQRRDVDAASVPTEAELRAEEYMALQDGNVGGATDAFHCQQVDVDPSISDVVAQVSKVSRLREVRALHGFARVSPTGSSSDAPRLASLSIKRLNWLPAVEVFGEGVFVRLDLDGLQRWEETSFASQRIGALTEAVRRRAQESGASSIEPPSPRFVAVHTVAHAVLKELSLDAGYPTGAMRERVFADGNQAGFLIYTASSDAAGSLGGLAALAEEERFAAVFRSASSRSAWCSNDPVCAESGPSGSDGLNLAACHACLLLPETSCEERNIYLDRVSLVGDMRDPSGGLLAGI